MRFSDTLLAARTSAGLTQSELSARSGVARPNIVAFESDRREPRWTTATRAIRATGAEIDVRMGVRWSWTPGLRPYAVPSALWRLPLREAIRVLTPAHHVWWSGDAPRLDLAVRSDRVWAYELVLREGAPSDISSIVDGALLIDTWDELVLPSVLRAAWQPAVDHARDVVDVVVG